MGAKGRRNDEEEEMTRKKGEMREGGRKGRTEPGCWTTSQSSLDRGGGGWEGREGRERDG